MKIYTFQNPIVLDIIKNEGIYSPLNLEDKCEFLKACKEDNFGFLQAYQWLREEMIKRKIKSIGEPNQLIWGWGEKFSENSHNLRFKRNREIYNGFILLELDISEDRLCQTCFYSWHNILNNSPILPDDQEHLYEEYNQNPLLKEMTWQRVFDLYFMVKKPCVQHTFFQILEKDIVSVKKIDNFKVKRL